MNAFKTALLGASFLIAATAAASAADLGRGHGGSYKDEGSAYLPAITWTGFYAGVHAGSTFGDTVEIDGEGDFDIDNAFVGGVQLGYNWQQGNVVYGLEGSIGLVNDETEAGFDQTDYLASIRGRLGYAFDKSLVYGTAGVAFLQYADDVSAAFDDDLAVGFVVGGGWDYKLTDNVSFGVEGLYYNFSSDSVEEGVDIDRDFFTVQARLNYHFNSGYESPLK
ncbi:MULTISPECIES: outer membrane beta-barrel protein [Rhodomicrobium]|uniref:outer membrane protein n=1 Tax=Rhodomicrobium TaxID=1068 RepID=UPI0015953347|nr:MULTISPECIES: outer membrane beta-barrel protein [Rhodomicrobium]